MSHTSVVVDACTLLNLYATGRCSDVLDSFDESVVLTKFVRDREILSVYTGPVDAPRSSTATVLLDQLVDSGHLSIDELSDDEADTFLELVVAMHDDGEAATGAVAICRAFAMATDDKKAIAVMSVVAPQIEIVTTPDIIHHWSLTEGVATEDVRVAIQRIRNYAVYTAPNSHELKAWWQGFEDL